MTDWTEKKRRDGSTDHTMKLADRKRAEHNPTVSVYPDGKVYAKSSTGYATTFHDGDVDKAKAWAHRPVKAE